MIVPLYQLLAPVLRNTPRVSFLTTLEQETGYLCPVAVVGLSPEEEWRWWREIGRFRLDDFLPPVLLSRLRAGEAVLIDPGGRKVSDLIDFSAREVLIAPMQIDNRLVGMLSLDYEDEEHTYAPEEVSLADAVAKLATLAFERERLLQERIEARAKELALRKIIQQMDEFLGILAHELRTPLSSLKGFAQTLLVQTALHKGPRLAAWQEKALTGIDLAVAHLSELIDNLLDMARVHAGQLELHPEPTNLVSLARRVVAQLQLTTERHSLSCLPTVGCLIRDVDPRRMEQVLGNLISNAIKYSPEGGPIEATIAEDVERQEALLSVHDHGISIPAHELSRIFQRFVRADNTHTYGIEGAGLGLYLCRALVERHGGRIWCESVEGEGSTFFIALPVVSHATREFER